MGPEMSQPLYEKLIEGAKETAQEVSDSLPGPVRDLLESATDFLDSSETNNEIIARALAERSDTILTKDYINNLPNITAIASLGSHRDKIYDWLDSYGDMIDKQGARDNETGTRGLRGNLPTEEQGIALLNAVVAGQNYEDLFWKNSDGSQKSPNERDLVRSEEAMQRDEFTALNTLVESDPNADYLTSIAKANYNYANEQFAKDEFPNDAILRLAGLPNSFQQELFNKYFNTPAKKRRWIVRLPLSTAPSPEDIHTVVKSEMDKFYKGSLSDCRTQINNRFQSIVSNPNLNKESIGYVRGTIDVIMKEIKESDHPNSQRQKESHCKGILRALDYGQSQLS